MKRYLVLPGYVRSMSDGETHFVTAVQLMRLYGVSPAECVIQRTDRPLHQEGTSLIPLAPRHDGHYELPGEEVVHMIEAARELSERAKTSYKELEIAREKENRRQRVLRYLEESLTLTEES